MKKKSIISNLLKNSSYYALGNILRQLIGFIMLPIYTSHLTPKEYGIIGVLTFSISLIDLLFGARLVQAIPKFYYSKSEQKEQYSVVSTALIQTSFISFLTVSLLICFSKETSMFLLDSNEFQIVVILFGVTVLTQAIENYGLLFIRLQNKPKLFLVVNLVKLLFQLTTNIYLVVYLELSVLGIAISLFLSSLLFAIISLVYTIRITGLSYDFSLGISLIKFSWPLWIGGLASLYIGSSNRFFLKEFSNLSDVGLLELATKFSTIIMILVWRPFNLYWQTERFNLYNNYEHYKTVFRQIFGIMSVLLCCIGLGISIFSEMIIDLMASVDYHGAKDIVPVLTVASITSCITIFFNFSYFAKDKTIVLTQISYLTAIIATVLYVFFIYHYGLIGAAYSYAMTSLFQFGVTYILSKRYLDLEIPVYKFFVLITIAITVYLVAKEAIHIESIFIQITINLFLVLVFLLIAFLYILDISYLKIRKKTLRELMALTKQLFGRT